MEIKTFTRTARRDEGKGMTLIRTPDKNDIIGSILLFLVSRAGVVGMFPFAAAMFAAVYDKRVAYLGILSVLVGVMSAGAGMASIKYMFATLIFWLFTRLYDKDEKKTLSAVVCGGGLLLSGGVLLPYTNPTLYGVLMLIAESVLTSFLYIAFCKARVLAVGRDSRTQIGQEELICLGICAGGVIAGFSGINLPGGIAICHVLALLAVMTMILHANPGVAVCGGMIMGLICGMNSENAILSIGFYGICAIFGGLLRQFGKIGVAVGILGGTAVTLLYIGNVFEMPVSLVGVIISAVMFMAVPKKVQDMIGGFLSRSLHMDIIRPDIRVKRYLGVQLEKLSGVFLHLQECLENAARRNVRTGSGDVCDMFDFVADKVCKSCGMCPHCWQKQFSDTYRQMFDILDVVEKHGICDTTNIPTAFSEKCARTESFLAEFMHAYEIYKQRAVWDGEANESRCLVAKQYRELSGIMGDMSERMDMGFSFLEDMEDKAVEELDKIGCTVREVSIIEMGNGALEIYLTVPSGTDIGEVGGVLATVLDTPLELAEVRNGTCRFFSTGVYGVEISTRQLCKSGQSVCGDSIAHFTTSDNKYCIILCDGMGSGEEAERESRLTAMLLSEFVGAGFDRRTAVEIVNSTLALRMEGETFSTIDMLIIDLITGVGEFIKVGAAQSYIKHGKRFETIDSSSLPVGMLSEINTEKTQKKFCGGEVVVMVTDGLEDIQGGDWLERATDGFESMNELAEGIACEAEQRSNGEVRDDISIVAVRITRI